MIGLAKLIGRTRRGSGIAGSVAALALAMAVVTPASATILERGSYDFTYSDVYDFCDGFDIEVEGRDSGKFHIRQGQGPSAAVFFSHRHQTRQETWAANGVTLTYSASETAVRTRATATDDPTIFLVHRIFAGHGKFEHEDGTVVVREGGIFKVSFLWDTATNEFVELVSFDARGHWPEVDLCAEFE